MRVLLDRLSGSVAAEVSDEQLSALYDAPREPWLRVNMVSSVDGAATGSDGKSGSINNAADKKVFALLRSLADCVLVGAGTARAEGYRPTDRPVVLVSRRAALPSSLLGAPAGSVLLVTCSSAEGLAEAQEELGDSVIQAGADSVDLAAGVAALHERGLRRITCEGGPHLLADLAAAGLVDELCATVVPRLVGGIHPRITAGPALDLSLDLQVLLEHESTLIARWFTA